VNGIEHDIGNFIATGKPAKALKILTAALRETENSELWNDWACAAFACGDSALAESGYRCALQLDPSHRQAAVNLAALLLGQVRLDESILVLETVAGRLTVEEERVLRQLAIRAKEVAQSSANSAPSTVASEPVVYCAMPNTDRRGVRHAQVVIVKPEGYVHSEAFAELAETLCLGLKDVGLDAQIERNRFDPSATNLVLGWHLLSEAQEQELPPQCIIYNLEQMDDKNQALRSRLTRLAGRCEVWDYSLRNIEILHQAGFPAAIHHVPIGTMSALGRIGSAAHQDIDVLFYGSINARRASVIEALKMAGLEVRAVFGVYGSARDALIARAKVVLNLHYYDTSIFEMVRSSYLWLNRKAVVAELRETTEIEEELKDAACFVPYDQLVSACKELVADPSARHRLEQRAFETISRREESSILRCVLEGKAGMPPRRPSSEQSRSTAMTDQAPSTRAPATLTAQVSVLCSKHVSRSM
jgi:hypothetical protein